MAVSLSALRMDSTQLGKHAGVCRRRCWLRTRSRLVARACRGLPEDALRVQHIRSYCSPSFIVWSAGTSANRSTRRRST